MTSTTTMDSPAGSAPADFRKARRQHAELADPIKVDRLPPHSIEDEQGTLGCCLLCPGETIDECVIHGVTEEWFYDLRHKAIWEAMLTVWSEKRALDTIMLQGWMKDRKRENESQNILEAVGGLSYIASLPDAVPSAANLMYYVANLRDKYILRRMISACTDIVGRAYEHQGEVDALLEEVERDLIGMTQLKPVKRMTVKEAARAAITHIEERHQNEGSLTGLSTGFPDLDVMTNGLQAGDMIVIAARPSQGKTALMGNIIDAIAINQKLPVGVFSLEMSTLSLVKRMIYSRGRLDGRRIERGYLVERDFAPLASAAGKVGNAPIYIDDTPALPLQTLKSRARMMVQMHGIKAVFVDYLQLLTLSKRPLSRQQEVTELSAGIKAIAKELGIPAIILAQLNREVEKGKGRRPVMSDLRESGAIEQDADLIAMLHKPEQDDDEDAACGKMELVITKQRNGPTGVVSLVFRRDQTRFESAAKISSEDIPVESEVIERRLPCPD